MTEFTLRPREEDTLKLNIGEESFQIPLATSLTLNEAAQMNTTEGAIDFFKKHIRPDVADQLTISNWRDVILAWKDASEKATAIAGGAGAGES